MTANNKAAMSGKARAASRLNSTLNFIRISPRNWRTRLKRPAIFMLPISIFENEPGRALLFLALLRFRELV